MNEFWSKVQKTDGCWLWNGYTTRNGYGQFYDGGETLKAHRVAYELVKGKIPPRMELDHLCRNRACVNPDHLELVTRQINQLRGFGVSGINARKTHCKNGHEFTPENTYYRSNGKRNCKICQYILLGYNYYPYR